MKTFRMEVQLDDPHMVELFKVQDLMGGSNCTILEVVEACLIRGIRRNLKVLRAKAAAAKLKELMDESIKGG